MVRTYYASTMEQLFFPTQIYQAGVVHNFLTSGACERTSERRLPSIGVSVTSGGSKRTETREMSARMFFNCWQHWIVCKRA